MKTLQLIFGLFLISLISCEKGDRYHCVSGDCESGYEDGYYSYSECTDDCGFNSGGNNNGGGSGGGGNSGGGGGGTSYGDVTFWTQYDNGCGNITVVLNGSSRTISSYYSSGISGCNNSGCANYNLAVGNYNFTASCSGLTWNGTVTISSGGCFQMELN